MSNKKYDVVIIGGGPGGYVAAIRASQLGFKVACIDKRKNLGGTCLNEGCIPSKTLLQSTEYYSFFSHEGKKHGIECQKLSLNFPQLMQRKSEVVNSLAVGINGLFKKNRVTRYEGRAEFISPNQVEVFSIEDSQDSKQKTARIVEGDYFLLATGSEPISLPFLPFDEQVVVSSTGALSLTKIPKKMAVIGAGVIGVELASVYNRIGTEVVLIEMLDDICPSLDKAMSKTLMQILQKQGLNFHLSTKVLSAKVKSDGVELTINNNNQPEGQSSSLKADIVLVAAGRRPLTKGLGLEKIGVALTPQGYVIVDNTFRTSLSHIFAIGDIIEGPMLAHRASEEGIAVVEELAGLQPHINYMAIPNVIYTHPEVASLGLTEEEARSAALKIKVGTFPFKGNSRARCTGNDDGLVKIIAEATSGILVGLHIIGPYASEMIGEGVIAIEKGATIGEIASASHAHPTYSEAIKEAALNALERTIHL